MRDTVLDHLSGRPESLSPWLVNSFPHVVTCRPGYGSSAPSPSFAPFTYPANLEKFGSRKSPVRIRPPRVRQVIPMPPVAWFLPGWGVRKVILDRPTWEISA